MKISFPNVRMLQEAKDAQMLKCRHTGKPPLSVGREILYFFIVFLISLVAQSAIITPFQTVAIMRSDEFMALIKTPTLNYQEIMNTVNRLLAALPDWFMAIQLFSTSATIAACFVYCRLIEKRSWVSLGFAKKGAVTEYAAGLGIGLALFASAVLICMATGQVTLSVNAAPAVGMIILYFVGYMIQGMSEEILCRSYLMVSIQRGNPLWVAVLTNALLFTSLHIANPGITPLALVNLTLFGIFASLYTLRRGSIWGIGAIHTIWNFAQGNLFGISVSGMGGSPSILQATLTEGGSLMHGGAFGMEGGIAVTVVLTLGCVAMLVCQTKKSEIVEISPAV